MPGYEDDVARVEKNRAQELDIDLHFGESASEWEQLGDGITILTENEDGDVSEFVAEKALVTVGREPVTDTLTLDAVGLEPDEGGFLATDDSARTAVENVFAVGDFTGEPTALDYQSVPAAVFTDLESGTVGMTEEGPGLGGEEIEV